MVLRGGNEVIVTCNCGCDTSIDFKKNFNLIWVSTLSGDFYNKQAPLFGGLKEIYRNLKNRHKNKGRKFLSEVCMTEQEIIDMVYALEDLIEDMDDSKLEEGDLLDLQRTDRSTLHMTDLKLDEDGLFPKYREYTLELESHSSLKDIIFHGHRQYDESYSRAEMELFIKKVRRLLRRSFEKNLERKTEVLFEGMRFKNTIILKLEKEEDGIRYFHIFENNFKSSIKSEREILEKEGFI